MSPALEIGISKVGEILIGEDALYLMT